MSLNKNYKIIQDSEFGRHLIASRDIQPGEIIIDEPPLVAGPVSNGNPAFSHDDATSENKCVCPVCCVLITDNFQTICDKCGLSLCSVSCSNSPSHSSRECKIIQKLNEIGASIKSLKEKPLYNLINVIRCLFHRIHSPEIKWVQMIQLESKVKALEKVGTFTDLDPLFQLLRWEFFIDASISQFNLSTLSSPKDNIFLAARHCLGAMRTNSFSSFTNTHAREGLYFLSSLMSHSCVMNTDRQIDQDRMVTRAGGEIKSGQPITTSYLSYLSGTPERFNETRSTWLFTCQCLRCTDPTECGTQMSTVSCPSCAQISLQPNLTRVDEGVNPKDDDFLMNYDLIWKCAYSDCNQALEKGLVPPALEVVQKFRPPITKDMISDIEEWLEKYDNRNYLHPSHYLFAQAKFYLCQYYGRGSNGISSLGVVQLRKKVDYCLEILQIFNELFQGIYTFRGIILFELWCGLSEIKRRTQKDLTLIPDFQTIDYSHVRISQIRTDALNALQFALVNSAEESMGLVLSENES